MTLYSLFGEQLKREPYYCARDRYDILATWGAMYGKRFNDCYVHLRPDENKQHVKENGMNSNNAHDFKHELILEEP